MLDIYLIRNNTEKVVNALAKKGYKVDFAELLEWDALRRNKIAQVEKLKAERNKVSADIPRLKKLGEDVSVIFDKMRKLGEDIAREDKIIGELAAKVFDFLSALPNMPDEDLAAGEKENNQVIRTSKEKPIFDYPFKNHVDLCTMHNLVDYERGVKLAGGGHWIYKNIGAQLEWALLNFFIDEHIHDGYEFILPPHMLNYNSGFGAGQFPKFEEDVFWLEGQERKAGRFMLPTAETALVNLYANEIIDEAQLPIKLFAYTPCYRKEAGSYGTEERGMIRGHQFNKVEMVQLANPSDSDKAFEELVEKACSLVTKLGLHYRLSKLAAGDCSAAMARTYDIEVWIPSMNIYKEVSSVSNANDYQARRNNTRYRDKDTGKTNFIHTLNGSGLATSRLIPAIVEQMQNEDGSIAIPKVLKKYLNGLEKIG